MTPIASFGLPVRIGVLADTHIPRRARVLPPAVVDGLAGVDLILHAGDLTDPAVLNELTQIAPVHAVAGNNDSPELSQVLGRQKVVLAGEWRIGLVHGHEGPGRTTLERALGAFSGPAVDCVVFGHSHMPHHARHGAVLAFNPGSPTDRRRSPRFSYGILAITTAGIDSRLVYFDR